LDPPFGVAAGCRSVGKDDDVIESCSIIGVPPNEFFFCFCCSSVGQYRRAQACHLGAHVRSNVFEETRLRQGTLLPK